jgi:simple sugar transport system ATP-binding protein
LGVNDTASSISGQHLAKRFGHVQALSDASVTVAHGEVVALLGDNGAGKSTMLKILLGIVQPDAGAVQIGGRNVELASVRDSQAAGVECVYQDLSLAPDLSVADNMFLGKEILHSGIKGRLKALARRDMAERADAALRDLGIALPSLFVSVRDLSGGQRQAVAVARAVMWARTAVLLDEPTAALGARQSEIVCERMRRIAEKGLGVLVVSHDLPRMLKVADRVSILWRGKTALDADASSLTVPDVVETMVGFRESAA